MKMKRKICAGLISISLFLSLCATAWAGARQPPGTLPFEPPLVSAIIGKKNRALEMALSLESSAKADNLKAAVAEIIAEIARGTAKDRPSIREAIAVLSGQSHTHAAFHAYYRALPAADYRERLFALALIGELRAQESFSMLLEVVWSPLPGLPEVLDQRDGMSEQRSEETVRIKAIHGIGYLRTEQAFQELKKIMCEHESKILRASAIDTYLWNRGDDPAALAEITQLMPKEFHRYIGMARFHGGVEAQEFSRQLKQKNSAKLEQSQKEGRNADIK